MFDAASPGIETPVQRGPHLAEPVGRPQASTRPPGGGIRQDCQTLMRALDVVFMIAAEGGMTLPQIQDRLRLTKSTAYRLASALLARGLLVRADQIYSLGPRWIALAALAPEDAASAV